MILDLVVPFPFFCFPTTWELRRHRLHCCDYIAQSIALDSPNAQRARNPEFDWCWVVSLLNTDWTFDFVKGMTKSKKHCCPRMCSSWICFAGRSPWPEHIVGTSIWLTPEDRSSFSGIAPKISEGKSKPLVVGTYFSLGGTIDFPYGLLPNLNPTHPHIHENLYCTGIEKITSSKPVWARCRILQVAARIFSFCLMQQSASGEAHQRTLHPQQSSSHFQLK